MKYKLIALNVFIGGKVYKKEDNPIFNLTDYPEQEVLKAVKDGFLVEIKEVKKEVKKEKTDV